MVFCFEYRDLPQESWKMLGTLLGMNVWRKLYAVHLHVRNTIYVCFLSSKGCPVLPSFCPPRVGGLVDRAWAVCPKEARSGASDACEIPRDLDQGGSSRRPSEIRILSRLVLLVLLGFVRLGVLSLNRMPFRYRPHQATVLHP